MVTTVLFVRHGQTDWNHARRWQGHRDVPLNETGIAQSRALARRLVGWPIAALYSSDLRRAAMTAELVAEGLALAPVFDPVWRERHVGRFEGLTGDEVRSLFPELVADLDRDIFTPPGGESDPMLRRRAEAAFWELVARHPGETVVVVSHGGTIGAVLANILGLAPDQPARLSLRGNTGLSIVEVGARGPRLTLLNDTSHLDCHYSPPPPAGDAYPA
jgi:broad specificity phosphatase PhoE